MANAITDNFREDIGIDQNQFNVGQQMLSLGIVLFEIPSNMVLYRVGPGKWLTLQLFLFGTVSTFQAWQTNYASFIVTRFLLGVTESGFIPGGLWTLSTWYTRKETAKRVMVFYFGNQFGQASAKLLAFGILHMRGVAGRPGWFWLFVLMGGFTCASGVVLGLFLPDSFKKPRSTFLPNVEIFTGRELHILNTRVLMDDPMKGQKKKRIGRAACIKLVSRLFLPVSSQNPSANNQNSSPAGGCGSTSSSRSATTDRSVRSTHTLPPSSAALVSLLSHPTLWPQSVSSSRSQSRLDSHTFPIASEYPSPRQHVAMTPTDTPAATEEVRQSS
jgi:hypothetical protein